MFRARDYDLKTANTFAVSARCREYVAIDDREELLAWLDRWDDSQPLLILGEGSNLLFTQDFPGIVLAPRLRGIGVEQQQEDAVWVRAQAGEDWDAFVAYTLEQGWYGLENLSLIPGTVGAGPMQNIGAYGVELAEFVEQVEAYDLSAKQHVSFDNEQCRFGYRDSWFKHHRGRYLIISVLLRLSRQDRPRLMYQDLQTKAAQVEQVSAHQVRQWVCEIRRSKLPDPARLGNAGSFFKNLEVTGAELDRLRQIFPECPAHALADGRFKVPSAWLIDQRGWKGYRQGDAGVHERQALVLVNHGNATGAEIWDLAQRIQADIQQIAGFLLEPEPLIL